MKHLLPILWILFFAGHCDAQFFGISAQQGSSSPIHYRIITIPTASVGSSDISGFPVLIDTTLAYMKSVANGGEVQTAGATDVYFSSDAPGASVLPFDRISHNLTTGMIQYAVKMNLSSTVSNTIYMHYGDASITTDKSNRSGTWDANYMAVWPMTDTITAAGQLVHDRTSNAHNYTTFGTWTSAQQVRGPEGGALKALNANGDYLQWATSGTGGLNVDFTAEIWVNVSVADQTSFTFGAASFNNDINPFGAKWRLFDGGSDVVVDGTTAAINTWVHLVVTRKDSTFTLYHNGVNTGQVTTHPGFTYNFQNLWLNQTLKSANAICEDARLSTIARLPNWIACEYLNESSEATFLTIGAEN